MRNSLPPTNTLLLLVMSEEVSRTEESHTIEPSIGHVFSFPINPDYDVRYRHQSSWENGTVYSLMAVIRRLGDHCVIGDELIKASAITPGRIFSVIVPAGRLVTIYCTKDSVGLKDFFEIDQIAAKPDLPLRTTLNE